MKSIVISLMFILSVCTARTQGVNENSSDSQTVAQLVEKILGKDAPQLGILAQADAEVRGTKPETYSNFFLNNVRFYLAGSFEKDFQYLVQTSFINEFSLMDLRLSYLFNDHWRVDAGQFKAPYGKEYLRNDGNLTFVRRSTAAATLGPLRQRGVQIATNWFDKRFMLTAGVFNGAKLNGADSKMSLVSGRGMVVLLAGEKGNSAAPRIEIAGSIAFSHKDLDDNLGIRFVEKKDVALGGFDYRIDAYNFFSEGEYSRLGDQHYKYAEAFFVDVARKFGVQWIAAFRFDWSAHYPGTALQISENFIDRTYTGGVIWYPSKPLKLLLNIGRDKTNDVNFGLAQFQYAINYEH